MTLRWARSDAPGLGDARLTPGGTAGASTGFPVGSRTALAVFIIQLDTSPDAAATDADLAAAFSTISAAGGSEVSVLRHEAAGRPHAAFSLEAESRSGAARTVDHLLSALAEGTPSIAGGWFLVSLRQSEPDPGA
jgi:hypothetical protein